MRSLLFTRTLGAGAFGTVYLAELSSGQGFRRQVAVKVLQRHHPDSQMFLSRIRDEARLLGLLQDDSILKVLDMVHLQGRDAVIMEYVEGVDLDSLVESGNPPPGRVLAELGAGVAGALARAHSARHPTTGEPLNVIHRDVKPANVMVTSSGGVKLLDFGVARARFDARESHTGQLVLGTLNYMAPEYIVTGEVSPAADVYGLALSLWQVAAGETFGQPKVRQDGHERRLEKRLGELAPEHAPLLDVLRRMLDWDPDQRPPASEIEQELQEVADAMSGASLRTWARRTVPAVLAGRSPTPDPAGLLGQDFPMGAGDAPQGSAFSAPAEDPDPPTTFEPNPPTASPRMPPAPAIPEAAPQPPAPALRGRGTFRGDASRESGHDGSAATRSPSDSPAQPSRPTRLEAAPPPPAVSWPPAPAPALAAPSPPPAPAGAGPNLVKTVLLGLSIGGLFGMMAIAAIAWMLLG